MRGITCTWYARTKIIGHGKELTWRPGDAGTVSLRLVVFDIAGDGTELVYSIHVQEKSYLLMSGPAILAPVVISAIVAMVVGVHRWAEDPVGSVRTGTWDITVPS